MTHLINLILPLTLSTFLFAIGFLGIYLFERRVNYSRSIVLLLGAYGLIISEVFIVIYSISHIHSFHKFHFHFPNLDDHEYFSQSNPVHIPSILILSIACTFAVFLSGLVISQISLRFMSKNLIQNMSEPESENIKLKYQWLPDEYKLIVIDDNKLDAFTFTLLRRNGRTLKAENWIILTSNLTKFLDDEEIEMVLAHEFSHTNEYDTRYAHLVYTIASIIFFDPMLKIFKLLIHENHEYNADLQAVKLIKKPRKLASALFKLLKIQLSKPQSQIATGIVSSKKPLILKRIEKLIEYAETHNL